MSELFKSKKIWPPSIIFPKKHAFKRLGVLGIIFLFGTAAFISGFSINSYAASSSTVLPISRGGTNANTAAQASSNILGSDFANYNGILPVAKGGTGSNNQSFGTAQNNLNGLPKYTYLINGIAWQLASGYIRVGTSLITASYSSTLSKQDIYVIGFTNALTQLPQEYMLSIKINNDTPKTPENVQTSDMTIHLKGFSLRCNTDEQVGYYTVGPSQTDPTKAVVDVWLWRGSGWTIPPTLTWFYYNTYANTIGQFTPAFRETNNKNDMPEGAAKIYPYCTVYTSPSPTPTPTPTPTETP